MSSTGRCSANSTPPCRSDMERLVSQRAYVDTAQIHFLKFIVEAYDNLAIMSTLDRATGQVELRYPAGVADEVDALLDSLTERLSLKRQA